MFTRRDCFVALAATLVTMATVVWAQSDGRDPMRSVTYLWERIPVESTATGEKRDFFRAETATLDQLSCHVTTVNPGQAAHAPHSHPEEELIIVKEGTLESMQNGEVTQAGPGSIIFEGSDERHGIRNIGDTPATYYVIKWWTPGMLKGTKD
jgi:XRE family transcriptional regulator, regulator of sulfur utilization